MPYEMYHTIVPYHGWFYAPWTKIVRTSQMIDEKQMIVIVRTSQMGLAEQAAPTASWLLAIDSDDAFTKKPD